MPDRTPELTNQSISIKLCCNKTITQGKGIGTACHTSFCAHLATGILRDLGQAKPEALAEAYEIYLLEVWPRTGVKLCRCLEYG